MAAVEEYRKARKLARRQYRKALLAGESPHPPALEELLAGEKTLGEQHLGLTEIPLAQMAGTRGTGRKNAFSPDFLPLFEEESEFARKWMRLYEAQMEEGIRDPVVVCEYKNQFYVQEGNKRVSVMKYLDIPGILADVTRILPERTGEKESRVYYEFVEFYQITGLNGVLFLEPGSYGKLLEAVGKNWNTPWTREEIQNFKDVFSYFQSRYEKACHEENLRVVGEAFLRYLDIFPYEQLVGMPARLRKEDIRRAGKEIEPRTLYAPVEHVMEPERKRHPAPGKPLTAAFVYDRPIGESGWIYAHELGRLHVEEACQGRVKTRVYHTADFGGSGEEALKAAVAEGSTVVFTVAPTQMQASVQTALKYPQVHFFNCSLNFPYKSVRTYYARTYEAKFLTGLVAGILCGEKGIGYEADYPIYGTVANINAFALGVRMVRPEAKIRLVWRCVKEECQSGGLENVALISAKESITSQGADQPYGLYERHPGGGFTRLATSILDWGKFYEQILQFVQDGTWKRIAASRGRTLNYWWGFSAGVLDLVCSARVPYGPRKLVEHFKQAMEWGMFHPFEGVIRDQAGAFHGQEGAHLDTEEIITMDWLCDNVVGSIPEKEMLKEEAVKLVKLQGIGRKG